MKKSQKKLLKEIHTYLHQIESVNYGLFSERLEQEFPELFEKKLEVGKWYRRDGELAVWNNGESTYGFNKSGKWMDKMFFSTRSISPATLEEVEQALIKEAKRRGLVNDVLIELTDGSKVKFCFYDDGMFLENGVLYWHSTNYPIFDNGKWAKPLKKELEVGKWYKLKGRLFCISENSHNKYGFNLLGKWIDDLYITYPEEGVIATPEEVEQALIKEAKKRGFKKGVMYEGEGLVNHKKPFSGCFEYFPSQNTLDCCKGSGEIFRSGKWAEPLQKEMTMEEIEKIFGCKVKIVKQ